jgi:Ran GTPase-activating protein (RanGAP) involved in mRNA processing and transport
VGNETMEALAAAETAIKLKELRLARVGATDAGLRAVASSPRMSELRVLNLAANTFTDEGAQVLLDSPYLPDDLQLSLRVDPAWQQLTTETIEALLERYPALEV